ncbi:MAG TPA: D-alanyl-D-alanine carboxypeptidase family protein [Clostridiales bacterium]|nr:MAG: D-alanyl-D-alanine carboxypeptidase DacF precursor [Firmicutes bacterium ADurb.Bin262]HOU09647.1 D-alanyl-D-alanine carboxypeptidase family protein [Clostridiales bacterium]HQH62210.1 D-alanyl-D-alanine carboxypeptidase family protein [Clostridiales bacterium]HQK72395.1 D-alanyl-D-alanine carboxypeptidase family protein [Clostridiales bacterium]
MKKTLAVFICAVLIVLSMPAAAARAAYNSALPALALRSRIILLASLDNGSIIFSKNAEMKTSPASLTKIVTALLVLERCKDLEAKVTVPEYAVRMFDNTDSSNAGIVAGEVLSVGDLLRCMLVKSANEAAAILADHVAGGQDEFVAMMNAYLIKLGCKNTAFVNVHGLDAQGQYTTASDMLKIVLKALEYPEFVKITSMTKVTIPPTNKSAKRELASTNLMMNSNYREYYCKYVSGIKTGSTSTAGKCVAAKASKDGYSYVALVMQAPYDDFDNDSVKENGAFIDCKKLLEWTFDHISLESVADPKKIVTEVRVNLSSTEDYVSLVPEKEVFALVPSGTDDTSVLIEPIGESLPESIDAPVEKGRVIGRARILYAGEEIAQVNLAASKEVKRNIALYLLAQLHKASGTAVFKIVAAAAVAALLGYVFLSYAINRKRNKKRKVKVLHIGNLKK